MRAAAEGQLENRRLGLWQVHLATLLAGATGLFGQWAGSGPALLVVVRSVTASVALFLALAWTRQSLRLPQRRDGWMMLLTGATLALHWLAFFRSIQISSVGVGLLSFSSYPLFVMLLEPLIFQERFRRVDLLTAVLVTVGLGLVTPSLNLANDITRGVCWGVLSAVALAVLTLLNRAQVRHFPALVITFYQMAWAAVVALPVYLLQPEPATPAKVRWLVMMGLVFTAVPQALFIFSLRHIRAQTASLVVALEPVYGIALAWCFFGERLSGRALLGGLFILFAVLLSSSTSEQPSLGA